jgi:hypothetical protein
MGPMEGSPFILWIGGNRVGLRPGYLRSFRIGSLELNPLFQPYLGMEEERGLEGADLALLEFTNGRAMMKYKTITTSES